MTEKAVNKKHNIDLTLILISWNTSKELKSCLYSVRDAINDAVQVIVVDNASGDDTVEMIHSEFPWVHLIANKTNYGFGKGCNIGLRESLGRYIFFLNPDSAIEKESLKSIVEFGDSHPEAGILGIKVMNPNGTLQYSCRHFPTVAAGLFRNSILGKFFPKNPYTRDYLMVDWNHNQPQEVDWVSGCALVIRKETIEELGGFDERFFMYCEDVDLAYRAKQKNWKVMYFPGAVSIHSRSKSSDKSPNHMIFEFHKSMYRFFKKHYAPNSSIIIRLLVPLGLIARTGFFIIRNRWHRFIWSITRPEEHDLYELVQRNTEDSHEIGEENIRKKQE